ncbi:hypothetical protein GCM10027610_023160 [Dactylosporangium cerinum]
MLMPGKYRPGHRRYRHRKRPDRAALPEPMRANGPLQSPRQARRELREVVTDRAPARTGPVDPHRKTRPTRFRPEQRAQAAAQVV